jgi:hypothetical protein
VEDDVSDVEGKKKSGFGLLDAVLLVAAVVGGILVLLWVLKAVAGVILFAFKLAILVVVVLVIVRIVHAVTRKD